MPWRRHAAVNSKFTTLAALKILRFFKDNMTVAPFKNNSSFITPTGSNTVIYSKNIHSKKHKKDSIQK